MGDYKFWRGWGVKTHIWWSVYKLVKSLWKRALPYDAEGVPVGVYQRGALTHEHQYRRVLRALLFVIAKQLKGQQKQYQ